MFGKYFPIYDDGSSTMLLGNYPQYLGKFSRILRNIRHVFWGKFTNFGVICVTKILGEIPHKFFYSEGLKLYDQIVDLLEMKKFYFEKDLLKKYQKGHFFNIINNTLVTTTITYIDNKERLLTSF